MALPQWLEIRDNGDHVIQIDIVYQEMLDRLERKRGSLSSSTDPEESHVTALRSLDVNALDQYWLEVVHQMAKLEHQRVLMINELDPWPSRRLMEYTDKDKWRLANYPEGRGAEKAAQGKEARELYRLVFGFLPN